MYGQTAGILRFPFGNPLDISREIALRLHVQIMPGYGTINIDRLGERLCDVR